ncbi:MAG: transglycosylase domain-containing protein [Clostridia bacterium]|nr:transglycosylase domain-containing protein [Clostridia bacterium]
MNKLKDFFTGLWRGIKDFAVGLYSKIKSSMGSSVNKQRSDEKTPLFLNRDGRGAFPLAILFATLKILLLIVVVAGFACVGLVLGIAKAYIDTTPEMDVGVFSKTDTNLTSYIYDSEGNVLTSFADMEYRDWADIDEIPDMLKNAVIAVEDVRFMKHSGIDLKRLVSAVISTLTNSNTHGASTITQQIIKNNVLTNIQSYKRKIQEVYLALELETVLDKDEILEAYLNDVYLGEANYGVKSAAKDYFGKELSELTIRECAMLAGLVQQPSYTNPRANTYSRFYDDGTNKMDRTDSRTDTVIWAMYDAGFITSEQRESALNSTVTILEHSQTSDMYDMPHFVEYAIYDVITHWLEVEGLSDTKANRTSLESELRTGGYKIYTTVDADMQHILEETVAEWDSYPELADPSASVVISTNADGTVSEIAQPQVSAVIIDYHTGEIKALIGSRTVPTRMKEWNRAYQSSMPVGSAIKPIAVYGPALDLGASPATIIANFEGEIAGYGGNGYPAIGSQNWIGPVTIRRGVTSSLNVVAARTLFDIVTTATSKEYLVNLGIDESRINQDGPGLALGTSGITPIEMAAAFGTIANEGEYLEPLAFTRVIASNGKVVLDADSIRETRQVFKRSTAYLLTDMMEDVVESGTGTAAQIDGMTVSGKTGTNDNYTSVYFAGMTPYYSASLWIGHDNYNQKLRTGSTGGTYAAPLWQAFMAKIHEGLDDKPIIDESPVQLGLVQRTVCSISGKLATAACYADCGGHTPITDWFYSEDVPTDTCDMHTIMSICTESGEPASIYCALSGVTTGGYILINSDSVYRNFDPEDLLATMPNIIFTDIPYDRYGSTEYETSALCSVHTPWYVRVGTGADSLDEAIRIARNLVAEVSVYLSTVENLPRTSRETLTYGINWVNYAIDRQDAAMIIQYTELLRLNYEVISGRYPPPVS